MATKTKNKMTVRELIEKLAKANWDAEVLFDTRLDAAPSETCNMVNTEKIQSISEFTSKGKPILTLNMRS